MSSLTSLLSSFYSLHYIEKHGNGRRGKIERRKREDTGNEAVRKWHADSVVPNEINKYKASQIRAEVSCRKSVWIFRGM